MTGLQSIQRLGINNWTGGQFSVFRVVFGLYVAFHFAEILLSNAAYLSNRWVLESAQDPVWGLIPNVLARKSSEIWVLGTLWSGILLCLLLVLGIWPRLVAPLIALLWGQVYACVPGLLHGSMHAVAVVLVLLVFVPGAPYGSWPARGRNDPGGEWRMPRGVVAAAWMLAALVLVVWGTSHLKSFTLSTPLEIGLAILAVLSPIPIMSLRWRPWVWGALMIGALVNIVAQLPELSFGWPIVLVFLFNPGWIPAPEAEERWVFYDGDCGLCHRTVRFLLAEDDRGAFRYAPLQGETVEEKVSEEERAKLPDSVVLLEGDRIRAQFPAVRRLLVCLGGGWRVLGTVLLLVPAPVGNAAYRFVARVRHRLFERPSDICAMLPPDLRTRFGA